VTEFENKLEILGGFYNLYRDDDELNDFFDYNDIGMPLAYLASEGLCELSPDGRKYVAETWDMLLVFTGIEDTGFENLDQFLERNALE
jgi:hypothetical protein